MTESGVPAGPDGELLRLLQDLIATDSQNPSLVPGARGEGEIAGYCAQYLAEAGLHVELDEVEPGRPNVVARLPGAGSGPTLMLCGHLDTVDVQSMEIEPFGADFRDGRVWGRGACDMKGGVAAALAAITRLARAGEPLAGDLLFAGVIDEEYASLGAQRLVQRHRADACVLTEPTDLAIAVAHRGFAWARVTTHGRAVHGSRWQLGVDAIAHMGRYLVAMERFDREVLAERRHPLLERPSIHASLISGGLGLSTYPDRCTLELERRTLPGESEPAVRSELARLAAQLAAEDPHCRAEVELFLWRDAYEIPFEHPACQALVAAATAVLGREPAIVGQPAWLDSAVLGHAGIPTAIIGPGGSEWHAPVEWVDFDQVSGCCRILQHMARDFCGTA